MNDIKVIYLAQEDIFEQVSSRAGPCGQHGFSLGCLNQAVWQGFSAGRDGILRRAEASMAEQGSPMAEDSDPEERCRACDGSATCQRCPGKLYRVLAGKVRVVCADCQGTGRGA